MKMFDARKTGMIGLPTLPYGEKNYDDMLSRFHTIPACHGQTDGRTDGRTELVYQYLASAAGCWHTIIKKKQMIQQVTP